MPSTAPVEIDDWVRACRRKNRHSTDLCGLVSESAACLDAELEASKGLRLLDAAGVSSAPVVDDNGVLVGVVFLSTLARLREEKELEIEDAMITSAVTVPQGASVADVARLMARHGLDRLPVITADGHLLGMISAMDVVRWLAERLPP